MHNEGFTVKDIMKEFDLETIDEYFERSEWHTARSTSADKRYSDITHGKVQNVSKS